jgi:adenylate cyclase
MADSWLIRVYEDHALVLVKECASPVEFGRQGGQPGESLYSVSRLPDGGSRVVIARNDEVEISRRLARVEKAAGERVLVRNLSDQVPFRLQAAPQILPGREYEAELPLVLTLSNKAVLIQKADQDDHGAGVQSLDKPTEPPLHDDDGPALATLDYSLSSVPEMSAIIDWLRAMVRVLHSAAFDADFFRRAAQSVVEVVRLDLGRVLTRDGSDWKTAASFPEAEAEHEQKNPPSRLVVNRVCKEKRTSWLDPLSIDERGPSLAGVASVVAAPVLSRSGDVIAILYGERRLEGLLATGRSVSRLDAMVTEVLAVGLAAGLARLEEQRATLALQAQFEQFFTPELARQLTTCPEMLTGQDMEITVLFCDIRGFSRISRNCGTAFTLDWINDVLSTLSDFVLKHHGVLVDYIGDELFAMWGAPEAQPDHAERACRAALEMIGSLPVLNLRWQAALGEPMELGISVNSGMARVGNTGSRRKFKYGPLGDTVNVASRVQSASRYFKLRVLVTQATRERLGPGFVFRRLGAARLFNLAEPVELFELLTPEEPDGPALCAAYEVALAAFEAREFRKARQILDELTPAHRDDGPSSALLARAVACLIDEPEPFDPTFQLPSR